MSGVRVPPGPQFHLALVASSLSERSAKELYRVVSRANALDNHTFGTQSIGEAMSSDSGEDAAGHLQSRPRTPARSPFRWAGSKRALVPRLQQAMPEEFGCYIEPFAGSACLFFATQPQYALLSDFNSDLIETYVAIRDCLDEFCEVISTFDQNGDSYYELREEMRDVQPGLRRSAIFYYLNRHSFNGVYRTNRQGHFNVPRGRKSGNPLSEEELGIASASLQGVKIFCQDYNEAIKMADTGDLLYLDPPYITTGRKTYGEYGYGAFSGETELEEFCAALRRADSRGVKILLSFGESDVISDVLTEWNVTNLQTRRTIAGKVSARKQETTEIIATNYPVPHSGVSA